MQTTWTKEQVQNLKRACYTHRDDDFIAEKLTELNIHMNMHERAVFVQVKCKEWKDVERLANEISEKLSVAH